MPALALNNAEPLTATPICVLDVVVAFANSVVVVTSSAIYRLPFALSSVTFIMYFNSLLSIYAVLPSIGNVPTV